MEVTVFHYSYFADNDAQGINYGNCYLMVRERETGKEGGRRKEALEKKRQGKSKEELKRQKNREEGGKEDKEKRENEKKERERERER